MPYEIKKYARMADGLAPPELKEVNPLGGAPVITDGSLNLAESGAIVGASMYFVVRYSSAGGHVCRFGPRS